MRTRVQTQHPHQGPLVSTHRIALIRLGQGNQESSSAQHPSITLCFWSSKRQFRGGAGVSVRSTTVSPLANNQCGAGRRS